MCYAKYYCNAQSRGAAGIWNSQYGNRLENEIWHAPRATRSADAQGSDYCSAGLTDELQQQAEIAAALMDLPVEDVRAELLKQAPPRNSTQIVTASGREGRQGR